MLSIGNLIMNFAPFLILCSLLQAGSEGTVPTSVVPVGRTPVVPVQTPLTAPAVPVPTAPAANTNQLMFTGGILELPRYHHIMLAAPERAVLRSLKTEQRDAAGNILRDANGNTVMVPIREGMRVFKDQVLSSFEDRELWATSRINQAQLEVAEAERDKVIEKEFAKKGVEAAELELESMQEANRRHAGIYSGIQIKQAELAVEQAIANLELQTYTIDEVKTREVSVRESELERTKTLIELRQLVSPIDGMVVRIGAAEGEWLREGDPVLEIMQLDTIRVKVRIDANRYAVSDVDGKQATIRAKLANGVVETFPGTVVFTDPRIQPGRVFEAFVEIQNRRVGNHWLLQPGLDGVDIVIQL